MRDAIALSMTASFDMIALLCYDTILYMTRYDMT